MAETKTDGFETMNGEDRKPFWVVYRLGEPLYTPLKYYSLAAAKKQAHAILKVVPSATLFIFKAASIIKGRVEADEIKL